MISSGLHGLIKLVYIKVRIRFLSVPTGSHENICFLSYVGTMIAQFLYKACGYIWLQMLPKSKVASHMCKHSCKK